MSKPQQNNSGKAMAVKQQVDTVRAALEKLKPQLALALPKHLTPERLMRVTMTAVQNTPKLLECDRTSLFAAVVTCAQVGLEPDGVLGQAYLVPFKKKVQFIPGYKGYLTLARNSGEISSIQAHEVCENDEFEYAYGLNEKLHHIPAEGDRGEITHFYAYAKFKDGGHVFEVLTRAQVDAIRDNSEGYKFALQARREAEADPKKEGWKMKSYEETPWVKHYAQMGRKTAIRRLANYLPLSVQRAATLDAAYEDGKHASVNDYGEIVLEGEAQVVDDDQQQEVPQQDQQPTSAASKLDTLAGDEPAAEKRQPRKTRDVAVPEPEPSAEPFPPPVGTYWENGELVDDESGEIVTQNYTKLMPGTVRRSAQAHGELVDQPNDAPFATKGQGTIGMFGGEA